MRPAPNQFNKVFRVPLSAKNRRANVVEWARIRSACAASVFEDGREDERDNQPRQTLRTLRQPKEKVRLFVFLRDLEDRPPGLLTIFTHLPLTTAKGTRPEATCCSFAGTPKGSCSREGGDGGDKVSSDEEDDG